MKTPILIFVLSAMVSITYGQSRVRKTHQSYLKILRTTPTIQADVNVMEAIVESEELNQSVLTPTQKIVTTNLPVALNATRSPIKLIHHKNKRH